MTVGGAVRTRRALDIERTWDGLSGRSGQRWKAGTDMPRYDTIKDPVVKDLLAKAQVDMRGGKAGDAVHAVCDAFMRMMEIKPTLLKANLPADDIIHHRQFPRYGAELEDRNGEPFIRFDRERFSVSEAITYWEWTLDAAVSGGF